MRPNTAGVLAMLFLASTALVAPADAQQRRPGGGPVAAPHIAAPAPHIAAPAPHIAAPAPRMAAPAPHFAAPAPHIAAPRAVAPPHFAARPAAPHISSPRIASPGIESRHITPRVATPHVTPRVATPHVAAPRAAPRHEAARPNTLTSRPEARVSRPPERAPGATTGEKTAGELNRERIARPGTPSAGTVGPGTVGQGPAARGRTATSQTATSQSATSQNIVRARNGGPMLRNPAFANVSRRDQASRVLAQSTFSGRFAQAGFNRDRDRNRDRHHHFGRVIGFLGAVFWPYAYDDFVDFTFQPYAYDTFWPYAYDDVYEGIYGGYAPEYSGIYASANGYANAPADGSASRRAVAPRAAALASSTAQICSGETKGLTDFPIERIAQQVGPDQHQQALLDDLRAATAKALDILRTACPGDLPSTPTGRFAAMRTRVDAMARAVDTVRPALERFYASLSDEQKERFNAIDQEGATTAQAQQPDVAQVCGRTPALPFGRIEQTLRLNDRQASDLSALQDASARAADTMKSTCAAGRALTPTARLAAMAQRLDAMLQALDTVQPALARFYASLSDEQKAQFNRLNARVTSLTAP